MSMENLLFETHLTAAPTIQPQWLAFAALCQQQGGKSLWIELARGKHCQQPMFSIVRPYASLQQAVAAAQQSAQVFENEGFPISRIKIEIPACPAPPPAALAHPYYEWHAKVAFVHTDELLQLCLMHQAHLSRNALKDSVNTRFVTLREYGSFDRFEHRRQQLLAALAAHHWQPLKHQAEYCLFDTDQQLDADWL